MDSYRVARFTPGKYSRIEPIKLNLINVKIGQGAQILRFPEGSTIRNITMEGGASYLSKWAVLRGSVFKLNQGRVRPIVVDGKRFTIPSGHTLMDQDSFIFTRNNKNEGRDIPFLCITNISNETFYLVHASYCHPDQLFMPQGQYTFTKFLKWNIDVEHMKMAKSTLYLTEDLIPSGKLPFNVLEGCLKTPDSIVVKLKEGGHIVLRS